MTPSMRHALPITLLLQLAGCGAETVGTAAVAAKASQEEVREGQKLQEDLTNKLNAATQLEQQRVDQSAQDAK